MTEVNKKAVVDALNSLEVIEMGDSESAYILVANNDENRAILNAVGVTSETINNYGDAETFCILSLGISEGYVNMYDGNKLLCFDEVIAFEINSKDEVQKDVVVFKVDGTAHIAVTIGANTYAVELTDDQKAVIKSIVS